MPKKHTAQTQVYSKCRLDFNRQAKTPTIHSSFKIEIQPA